MHPFLLFSSPLEILANLLAKPDSLKTTEISYRAPLYAQRRAGACDRRARLYEWFQKISIGAAKSWKSMFRWLRGHISSCIFVYGTLLLIFNWERSKTLLNSDSRRIIINWNKWRLLLLGVGLTGSYNPKVIKVMYLRRWKSSFSISRCYIKQKILQ